MPIPIVCFDFDGTLVDNQNRIHPRDVEILASERGALFVPATGRPLHSVRKTLERNGLFAGRPIPFPLVLLNGGTVYRENEVLHAEHSFTPDVQAALMHAMQDFSLVSFFLFNATEVQLLWPSQFASRMIDRFNLDPRPFIPTGQGQRFAKVMCVSDSREPLDAFWNATADLALDRSHSLSTVLELNPAGINKGRGLHTLLDDLGSDSGEIIAMGDGGNDLPLFNLATHSFAPDTSPAAIQSVADYVINVREGGLLTPALQLIGLR